jgi:hypothetical protein
MLLRYSGGIMEWNHIEGFVLLFPAHSPLQQGEGGELYVNVTQFNSEEFQPYIEFMLNQLRKEDGFWFLGVENTFSYDAAIKMNEEVWNTMGRITAREIKEKFSIEEKGLKGLARVFRYFPWAMITGYEIETNDEEIIISVPHCPSQEGRLKKGLGEYDCKNMHFLLFTSLSREVDGNIKVDCSFAPPDPHPKELFCKWRFTMNKGKPSS